MKKFILSTILTVTAFFGGSLSAQDKQDKEVVQIKAALPDKPTVKPSKKHKILVYLGYTLSDPHIFDNRLSLL